jgi:hypothetical protein
VKSSLLASPFSIVFALLMTLSAGGSLLDLGESAQFGQEESFSTDQPSSGETSKAVTCGLADETSMSCEEMEQRILSTTLRIEIKTWIIYVEGQGYSSLFSNGHGTVMDGRYLLTHNHFRLPLLELLADESDGELATITLYTADGNLLWQGPLTTAAVAYDDAETLLLEFLDEDGRGLFDALGVPSAEFAAAVAQQITPGATVAQVNWDENQAYVQWTHVEDLLDEAGTPVLQLADCIIGGSSGGGVFFNGEHIANNWSRSMACVEGKDEASLLYSKAALNSAKLLAAGS